MVPKAESLMVILTGCVTISFGDLQYILSPARPRHEMLTHPGILNSFESQHGVRHGSQ